MAVSFESRPVALAERLTDQLEKPSLDNRSYRVIKLANKLEALLIHDPDTDKASAALDNNAGSFSDDESLPGMAHAVEHLLFMGTEKYPKENEYSSYLSNNSGHSNAFTAATSTNYYFEVSAKGEDGSDKSPLHGALDRFAQFFIAPLFLEETLDRELRAVDSENKKNLQSDTWRLYQLQKSLSNLEHPFHNFSTGNLKTLRDDPVARGVKIRDEFMRFHKEQYSANRMKLVVLGRESLDTLQEWVESMFSDVKNKDLPQNRWDDTPIMTEDEKKTQVFARPVMQTRQLEITFDYQDEYEMYDTQPGRYLSHLIGHEGPGSILSYIKEKGWANSLSAGHSNVCPGSGYFDIGVRLTPEGLKHYREVVLAIFQYIAILRQTAPQQWIFNEVKEMSEIEFKFKQKSPASRTTSGLSGIMQQPLPRKWLLSGQSLPRRFDSGAISKAMSHINPENFRMTIVSHEMMPEKVENEKWYGTEYTVSKIPEDFMSEIRQAYDTNDLSELYLPGRNEFIPSPQSLNVEKKEVEKPAVAPKLIRNDAARLWHKKDDQFWVPKGNYYAILKSPVTTATLRNDCLASLVSELVMDALVEYSYDADLAGLRYALSPMTQGILVAVMGYNDKMHVLLKRVLDTLKNLEIKEDRFDIIKEREIRSFNNSEYGSPYHQVGVYTRALSAEKGWTPAESLEEVQSITVDEVRQFHALMLNQFQIEALAHGNIHREDALRLTSLIETTLSPQPLPRAQWPIRRSLVLPRGANYRYTRPLKDEKNVNHCIEYVLQCCPLTDRRTYATLRLFAQMTEEPAFDTLRTKEQLGYVVFSGQSTSDTYAVYHVLVQSERDCVYLESRIDAFLRGFASELKNMSQETFESHRRSIINKRLEKDKNLSQETGRFWSHLNSGYYLFDAVDVDVQNLRSLSKQDVLDFYDRHISPDSRDTRAKLAVHLVAKAKAEGVEESGEEVLSGSGDAAEPTIIEDVRAWKASLPLSEGASPMRDLAEFEDLDAKL